MQKRLFQVVNYLLNTHLLIKIHNMYPMHMITGSDFIEFLVNFMILRLSFLITVGNANSENKPMSNKTETQKPLLSN